MIDDLEREFQKKLTDFIGEIKTKMQTKPKGLANQYFELALVFFSQVFPNLEDLASTSKEDQEGTTRFASMNEKLASKPNVHNESGCDVKKRKLAIESDEGKKKLQTVFKSEEQESTSASISQQSLNTTPSTSAVDNQSCGRSFADVSSSETLLSLRQTHVFKIQESNSIYDAKLLSSKFLLVTDMSKSCVRLYNLLGQELNTIYLDWQPAFLAILDETSQSCWNVAVSFNCRRIGLLEAKHQTLRRKSTIHTQRHYLLIAAMDSQTLAAGHSLSKGVDIIDLDGNVLCQISSDFDPNCMMKTEDQCLVLFASSSFNKVNLKLGIQDISLCVPEIENPRSIAALQNGSFVVADKLSRVVHLVGANGIVQRILWEHPKGKHNRNFLTSVTVVEDMLACCTLNGSVFIYNLQVKKN